MDEEEDDEDEDEDEIESGENAGAMDSSQYLAEESDDDDEEEEEEDGAGGSNGVHKRKMKSQIGRAQRAAVRRAVCVWILDS